MTDAVFDDAVFYGAREAMLAQGILYALVEKLEVLLCKYPCSSAVPEVSHETLRGGGRGHGRAHAHAHAHGQAHGHVHGPAHAHGHGPGPGYLHNPRSYPHSHHPHSGGRPQPSPRWGATDQVHAGLHDADHHRRCSVGPSRVGPSRGQSVASWVRQRARITCDKTPAARKMTAMLNKLTDRKYNGIAENVTALAAQMSRGDVVQLVLDQSVKQSCYAHMFVRLVRDLHASASSEDALLVTDEVSAFAASFFDADFLAPMGPGPGSDSDPRSKKAETDARTDAAREYDDFCEQTKAKARVIGKARTVLHLVISGQAPGRSLADYMRRIADRVDELHARVSTDVGPRLHQLLDLTYDLALEFRTLVDKHAAGDAKCAAWSGDVNRKFAGLLQACDVPKLRFKLMDVLRV